jgi:hypothetical protein
VGKKANAASTKKASMRVLKITYIQNKLRVQRTRYSCSEQDV